MRQHITIIIYLFPLVLLLQGNDKAFAFRPVPSPATSQLRIIEGNIDNLKFERFDIKVKIIPHGAEVDTEYSLLFIGEKSEKITLELYINSLAEKEPIEVLFNGKVFKYTRDHRQLIHFLQPGERSIIKIKYLANTKYTFSAPPAEWVIGEKFTIEDPLQYYLEEKTGREAPSFYSAKWNSLVPVKCHYHVEVPKGYQTHFRDEEKNWTVSENNGTRYYNLEAEEKCPIVEILKERK